MLSEQNVHTIEYIYGKPGNGCSLSSMPTLYSRDIKDASLADWIKETDAMVMDAL